jgi:Putative phage abortive infection protein
MGYRRRKWRLWRVRKNKTNMIKDFLEFWKDGFFKFSMFVFVLFGLLSICIMPLLLKQPAFDEFFNLSKGKDVADALNGLTSPFIALFASLLTFLAFYVQFKANIQQREQFEKTLENQKNDQKEQERIWLAEQFESRFFELLRFHRENMAEITLDKNIKGREAFVHFYDYFEKLYHNIEKNFLNYHSPQSPDRLTYFAYTIYFHGFNNNEYANFANKLNPLERNAIEESIRSFRGPILEQQSIKKFGYKVDDGVYKWLGHYYRHIYYTAKFVVDREPIFDDLNKENATKLEYMKILRSQLTSHEQIMLYYNAMAWFPDKWKEYFIDFKLIKNLPLPLASFGVKPTIYYKEVIEDLKSKGEILFEYQDYGF